MRACHDVGVGGCTTKVKDLMVGVSYEMSKPMTKTAFRERFQIVGAASGALMGNVTK